MSQEYFAQITPGLEELLSDELKAFKVRKRRIVRGGVTFEGTRKHLYRILWWSRLARRVYWTLGTWSAPNHDALFQRIARINWSHFIPKGEQVALKIILRKTPGLAGSDQVQSVISSAINGLRSQ